MQDEHFDLHAEVEDRHWWFRGRRTIIRRVLGAVVPADPARLVIDVGCGTGGNIAALAGDYRAVGIDTSERGIALARERYPAVEFRQGLSPAGLGELADDAGAVMLTDVLEHIEDDVTMLRAHVDALPAGAIVLITVPAGMHLWTEHDVSFGHYRRYDETTLAALWAGLPVRLRLLSHFNARLYPIVRGIRALTKRRGRAGTDLGLPPGPINRALEGVFAGEARRLVARIDDPRRRGYARGVSLIAVLERTERAVGA